MKQTIDLQLPTSWQQMSLRQLRLVFSLFATQWSTAEVKTICLLRWNNMRVITEIAPHRFLIQHGKEKVVISSKEIQKATATLDFLDNIPLVPVRMERIGRHRALPADFETVPFEKFLFLENLFQGVLYIAETDDEHAHDLLVQMARILYNSDHLKPSQPELVNVFYWFASLKQYFAKLFPHFYQPMSYEQNQLATKSLFDKLREATNAQIRALTAGDITKEKAIMKMDTLRALTELDAKAKEAEEIRKISKHS